MSKTRKILIGITIITVLFPVGKYAIILFRNWLFPEKAVEKFEYGRYSSWDWTPDGRIIYVVNKEQMEHTKGMGSMGYWNQGTVCQIRIINADGTGDRLIKETLYQSAQQKLDRRYAEIRKENNGNLPMQLAHDANRESSIGDLDKRYLDAPLAHIGWIDWNAKNNKLVFVANDGRGKTGIAVSDPEVKEVKWINYEGIFPKWSPDGTKIAFIKRTKHDGYTYIYGDIWIIDLKGNNEQQVSNGYWFDYFCWFPNGKEILGDNMKKENSGTIRLNLSTGNADNLGSVGRPSISPEGQWVIHNHGIMNLETGKKRNFTHQLGFPKWSPDGKHIIEGWEGGISILDFENNKVKNLRKVTQEQILDQNVVANYSEGQ